MLANWGSALDQQAQRAEGEEAQRLWRQAGEKYAEALRIKPDDHEVLNNWGLMCLTQCHRAAGVERERLLDAAEAKLKMAYALAPADTAYNLACLAAIRGIEEEANARLKEALAAGTLPDREHLVEDPDLASIRDAAWFRNFLDESFGSSA